MEKIHIAQVAHEVNKAYCESIGDTSQSPWQYAAEWQKNSALKGVQFHLDNPDASPSASHESWLKQKTEEGWKYGEVKNAETKEHPCFRPYDELPAEQRSKDYLFKQIIHSLSPFISYAALNPDANVSETLSDRPNLDTEGMPAMDAGLTDGGNPYVGADTEVGETISDADADLGAIANAAGEAAGLAQDKINSNEHH